jgi:threonine dehydrogenase-like Zn-dependent dehydrogenase
MTLHALRTLGHETKVVLVVEHSLQADVARRLGASDVVVGAAPGTTYEEIAEIVHGSVRYPEIGRIALQGGADLVYETTGKPVFIEDAINFTGEGNKLVLMGINRPSGFDITGIWFKGIEIRGTALSGMENYKGEARNTFEIAMGADTNKAALALYQKLGFEVVGELKLMRWQAIFV